MKTKQHVNEVLRFNKIVNKVSPVIVGMIEKAIEDKELINKITLKSKTMDKIAQRIEELKKELKIDKYFSIYLLEPTSDYDRHLRLRFKTHYTLKGEGFDHAIYLEKDVYMTYLSRDWQTKQFDKVEMMNQTPAQEVTWEQYEEIHYKCFKHNKEMTWLRERIEAENKKLPSQMIYEIQTHM